MKLELWPIDRLSPDRENARAHGRRNLEAITASLKQFGQRRAAVVRSDGRVLAGNGMLDAARAAGLSELYVTVVPDDWSDDQARAFALADNRSAELASWDQVLLEDQLSALFESGWDVAALGFDEPEPLVYDDDVPPVEEVPTRSALGDLWLLGEHRLVVGDSTDPAVLRRAAGGEIVHAVWTDPPYGVSYQMGITEKEAGQLRRRTDGKVVLNDELAGDELAAFLAAAFTGFAQVLRPGGAFYICAPTGVPEMAFRLALESAGLLLRQQLVWVKNSIVMGRSDYQLKHEGILYGWAPDGTPRELPAEFPYDPDSMPEVVEAAAMFSPDHSAVLYGWRSGAAHKWRGGRKQSSIWMFDRPKSSKDHPTMKPVPMVARGVFNSTDRGELVLDPFGGSGSTMAACYQTGRRSASVELDPRYADVIIARWEALSGGTAVRADGV